MARYEDASQGATMAPPIWLFAPKEEWWLFYGGVTLAAAVVAGGIWRIFSVRKKMHTMATWGCRAISAVALVLLLLAAGKEAAGLRASVVAWWGTPSGSVTVVPGSGEDEVVLAGGTSPVVLSWDRAMMVTAWRYRAVGDSARMILAAKRDLPLVPLDR